MEESLVYLKISAVFQILYVSMELNEPPWVLGSLGFKFQIKNEIWIIQFEVLEKPLSPE